MYKTFFYWSNTFWDTSKNKSTIWQLWKYSVAAWRTCFYIYLRKYLSGRKKCLRKIVENFIIYIYCNRYISCNLHYKRDICEIIFFPYNKIMIFCMVKLLFLGQRSNFIFVLFEGVLLVYYYLYNSVNLDNNTFFDVSAAMQSKNVSLYIVSSAYSLKKLENYHLFAGNVHFLVSRGREMKIFPL